MSSDWTSLAPADRALLADVVGELLHDWIKYMEMRLLSIDWSDPPADLTRLARRALEQTRRVGEMTRSASEILGAARDRLSNVDHDQVQLLLMDLDEALDALRGLLYSNERVAAAQADALVRAPGRRLRAVRDQLNSGK